MMKNPICTRGLRLWVQGLLLLTLRWLQLKTGFDQETGLALRSFPGLVLAAAILLCGALELFLALGIPKTARTYLNCLEPVDQRHLAPLAAGSLLLCAGGVLLPGWGTLAIAAAVGSLGIEAQAGSTAMSTLIANIHKAVAGAASALGLIFFARLLRQGAEPRALTLLPAMVFSVLFVLVVYLPEESNPVLERYYLPVLAASMAACAFYQLAGLACREGRLRWFVFFGNLAVPLCLAAMADCAEDWGRMLSFFGFALVLTVFLLTRRDTLLPEPEPEEEKNEEKGPGSAAQTQG